MEFFSVKKKCSFQLPLTIRKFEPSFQSSLTDIVGTEKSHCSSPQLHVPPPALMARWLLTAPFGSVMFYINN